MFTFTLPIFSIFFLFSTITTTTTTTGQPYNATENFVLNCGSSTPISADDGRTWDGDENSQFIRSNSLTISFSSQPSSPNPSINHKVYTSARIFNTSSFTYKFPVSQGPKFLRLYFYPATYSNLNSDQSFFSATSNGFSLLTNFNPSLTASFLATSSFVKEFIIHVKDNQILDLTFTPSPNSFAFINGIEVVSMPQNLYYKPNNFKSVGTSAPGIDNNTALENLFRLNVGGGYISREKDTGMYRSWDGDDNYIFPPLAKGHVPFHPILSPIIYTADTPNYTAPELVYQTQRTMGNMSRSYNLTWRLPVDSGCWYMVRLHFCNIIDAYTDKRQMIFQIFIQNQTVEEEADLFLWTPGSHYAVYKDYVVFVNADSKGERVKRDLWVALHPNEKSSYQFYDGFLNGVEVFKLSTNGNLSRPNPELTSTTPPAPQVSTHTGKGKNNKTLVIAGAVVGVVIVLLLILVLIIFRQRRRVKQYENPDDDKSSWTRAYSESKSTKSVQSTLPSDRCRRFPLTEIKAATDNFNDNCVIGMGGFGKVYKGYMDNSTTAVAIKRLNSASSQGINEFDTEIRMLSKLRHVNLVPLIGYCDDEEEMILVYDYMAHGTLREHLYKTNTPLSWENRLHICIGAAKGLDYLHMGANYSIIHRDVKSTNILLDDNFVAKVSDFGLSKDGPIDRQHVTTMVKGSIGYVDPEYYRTGQLTDKSDVYSFGVVLLEVLCARPVMIMSLLKEQASLAEWAKICYRKKRTLEQIVDVKVKGEIAPECLKKFGEVAMSCLKEQKSERPAMEEVVYFLELALKLQLESREKVVGEVVSDNQEFPFLMQGENTTTDDEVFTGSSAIRDGMSPVSSSFEGYKSETVFSEMQKSTGR